jgi:hypothetical protein
MKANRIVWLAASALVISTVALVFFKNKKVRSRLTEVADEGYELAHDVLYPLKNQRKRRGGYLPA